MLCIRHRIVKKHDKSNQGACLYSHVFVFFLPPLLFKATWTKLANLSRDTEKTSSPDEHEALPGFSTSALSAQKRPRQSDSSDDQITLQSEPSSSAGDSQLTKPDLESKCSAPAAAVVDTCAAESRRGKGKGRGKRRRATAGVAGAEDARTRTAPRPPVPFQRAAEATIADRSGVQPAEQNAKANNETKIEKPSSVVCVAVDGVDVAEEMCALEEELRALLDLAARTKGLFEWVDGPLVTAMRKGEIILLDELSLAEDAVLERLNSVLEPGRSITLAERGGQSDTGGEGAAETVVAAAGFRCVRCSLVFGQVCTLMVVKDEISGVLFWLLGKDAAELTLSDQMFARGDSETWG